MQKWIPGFTDPRGGMICDFRGFGYNLIGSGSTVPADASTGWAEGALFFKQGGAQGDQLYMNEGTPSSSDFNLITSTGVNLSGLTTTATELNRLSISGSTWTTGPATGITGGVGTVCKNQFLKTGQLTYSSIYLDLTGLQAIATDGDVIGDSTNPAYMGRILAAQHGVVDMVAVTCLEAPAGASADINFCTAIEATLKKDDAISGGTGVQTIIDAGGAWTNGLAKGGLNTPITANNYLYITNGAGANAGTYTAGKFLFEFWGT